MTSNCENFYLRHMNIQMILYLSMCSDSDSSGPVVTMAGLHAGQEMLLIRVFISHPATAGPGHSQAAQGEQRQIGVNTKEINVRENTTSPES